ncbi:unnamed protein product [Pieris macdunnoughi]|uniref:Secreted protein n=1 Tax=Pieris macdunnoughi TaxID=345717 RepID=A0A821T9G5_9NEOP|nr:unnamed protein product [Pieris macdunnoughi]
MTNTLMTLVSLQLCVLILQLPQEHTNHILVTMASKMPFSRRRDHQCIQGRCTVRRGRICMYFVPCWLKRTANVVRSWCVPEASNLEKRASADVHPVRVAGAVPEDVFFEHIRRSPGSHCYDEYPDEVGESSAACTDPSASSRAHEPHIRDFGEQDAVLLKKRSPVHPRTVLGQERPYKYVSEIIVGGFDPHPPSIKERPQCATGSIAARTLTRKVVGVDAAYFPDCDDEYPDDVGEPSAACTDPSASSRTHEPHIGDHGEQDAVLPKKSPVHPRTVLGQERPYKYCVPCWLKRTANVVRSWCVPEASNLEKRASADVHPVRVAGAVPEDVFFEHIRRSPGSRY